MVLENGWGIILDVTNINNYYYKPSAVQVQFMCEYNNIIVFINLYYGVKSREMCSETSIKTIKVKPIQIL